MDAVSGAVSDDDAGAGSSKKERILDGVIAVLAREGVAGVSIRAVAREADVAVGLANYYYNNKTELISAALERIGQRDLELVVGDLVVGHKHTDPAAALRRGLARALDPVLLTPDYLSLRLQLWSLAGVDPLFADINQRAQRRYLAGLTDLLAAARPELEIDEVERRATDILIVQNGIWLTAVLIPDANAVERALARCEEIALG